VFCKPYQHRRLKRCAHRRGNKMQSETAYFAPGAATWRTGRNI